jgi:hypothetical protein
LALAEICDRSAQAPASKTEPVVRHILTSEDGINATHWPLDQILHPYHVADLSASSHARLARE